jgi:hypothetical protein
LRWAERQVGREMGQHHQVMLMLTRTINEREAIRSDYQSMRDRIERLMRNAYNDGDTETMYDVLDQFRDQLDKMPSPYRQKIELDLDLWEKRVANR